MCAKPRADKLPKTQLPGTPWTKVLPSTLGALLMLQVGLLQPGLAKAGGLSMNDLLNQVRHHADQACQNEEPCVRAYMKEVYEQVAQAFEACNGEDACTARKYQQIADESASNVYSSTPGPKPEPPMSPEETLQWLCRISPADPDCNPNDPVLSEVRAVVGANVDVTFNGVLLRSGRRPYERQAFIRKGTSKTYLPVRALFQAMGMRVGFDAATQEILATRPGLEIRMTLGSRIAKVNGQPFDLEDEPIEFMDRTWVPLRVLMQGLGGRVEWDAANQTARVAIDEGKIQPVIPYNPSDATQQSMPLDNNPDLGGTGVYVSPLNEVYLWFPNWETGAWAYFKNSPIRNTSWASCIKRAVAPHVSDDGSFWMYYQTNQWVADKTVDKGNDRRSSLGRVYLGSSQHGMTTLTERECDSATVDGFYRFADEILSIVSKGKGK